MNIQKKSVLLAAVSFFCLSIKADSTSLPAKVYGHATISLIGSATTVGAILFGAISLHQKEHPIALIAGVIALSSGYTAYRAGFSAYTAYKKACASKKSLHNSSDNTAPEKTLSSEEQNSSLKSNIQEAALRGDTSL